MVRISLDPLGCTLPLVKTRWAFFIHAPVPLPASGVPSVMQTVRHIARVSRERESRHTRGGILAVALSRARSREPMPEAVENELVKPEKPWRPKTVCFLGVFAY